MQRRQLLRLQQQLPLAIPESRHTGLLLTAGACLLLPQVVAWEAALDAREVRSCPACRSCACDLMASQPAPHAWLRLAYISWILQ